jgi:hypothetical protein
MGVKCACGEPACEGSQAARLQSSTNTQRIYYNALFCGHQSLVDFVNTQPLTNPLVCLGRWVMNGISNLVGEFAHSNEPMGKFWTWYHSNGKSLALLGGRAQRLAQAGDLLWQGNVDAAYALAC